MISGDPLGELDSASSGEATIPPLTTAAESRSREVGGSLFGLVVFLASFLAAMGAWLVGESGLLEVKPAIGEYEMMGQVIKDATFETRQAAAIQTSVRVYGIFGAVLGLLLGVVGGLSMSRPRSAIVGGVSGAIAGGLAGAVCSLVVLPLFYRFVGDRAGELIAAMLMHWGMWIAIGAAAGLALGLGRGDRSRRLARDLLGGALGAILGVVIYELVGAFAFPLADTVAPIASTWGGRLVAYVSLALAIASGLLFVERERR